MKKHFLQSISALVTLNTERKKAATLSIWLLFMCFSFTGVAQVVVTPATGGTTICSSTAIGGSAASCTTLGNIVLTETNNSDIPAGGSSITLNAPAGWQFCIASAPTVSILPGGDVTVTPTITGFSSSSFTLNINSTGTTHHDAITIAGLQVQPILTSAAAGSIYASSVIGAIVGISVGPGATDFGDLAVIPAAITGPTDVCIGSCVTLTSGPAGGTWTSSNTVLATVTSAGTTASVCGHNAGSVTITRTIGGCSTTYSVRVDPLPNALTGVHAQMCAWYDSMVVSDSTGGGIFSSTLVTVVNLPATGGTAFDSGKVFAHAPGIATIYYTLRTGCQTTYTVTVDPLPAPIQTAPYTVCQGSFDTLTDLSPGGTWTSSATSIATIGSSSGSVYGVSPGTTLITYTIPGGFRGGCLVDTTFTVKSVPDSIHGNREICVLSTTLLTEDSLGGIWSTLTPSVAASAPTITGDSTIITGISAGTSIISYTTGNGCAAAIIVTVDPLPDSITVPSAVCVGDSILLSDLTPGGVWTSLSTGIGTVNSATGYFTGLVAGEAYVTYTINPGACSVRDSVLVNPIPGPVTSTGGDSLCIGSEHPISFMDTTTGGTWSVVNGDAYVDPTGAVTGYSQGWDTAVYRLSTGCFVTFPFYVDPLPSPVLADSNSICQGDSTMVSDVTPGGTWNSSDPAIGFPRVISPDTVSIIGVSSGVVNITYTLPTGCYEYVAITINPVPGHIMHDTAVCQGSSVTLTDSLTGGVWSSTDTVDATIGATTGIVTGISAASFIITYTTTGGCFSVLPFSVEQNTPIFGDSTVCLRDSIILTDSSSGNVWTLSDSTIARIHGVSGGLTSISQIEFIGVSPGFDTVYYTSPVTHCREYWVVRVKPMDSTIVLGDSICMSVPYDTTYSVLINSTTPGGGTWTTTPGLGVLTTTSPFSASLYGIASGIDTITYTIGGCSWTTSIYIKPAPAPIIGPDSICQGYGIGYLDDTTLGTWSVSPSPGAITINPSGIAVGNSAGVDTIIYTNVQGCVQKKIVTVNPITPITFSSDSMCIGHGINLRDTTSGGVWSHLHPNLDTLEATGTTAYDSGLVAGVDTIFYTIPTTGCQTPGLVVTVNPLPSISGPQAVCVGATITLTPNITGGHWMVSNGNASIGSASGIVTGLVPGMDTVYYFTLQGCDSFYIIQVNFTPPPISRDTTVCLGRFIMLTDLTAGGHWNSVDTILAKIDSVGDSTALVYGLHTGVDTITYTLPVTGCYVQLAVTVEAIPTITITQSQHQVMCIGDHDRLTATGAGPGALYFWSPAVGLNATTGASVTASPTLTTTYTVHGISEWGCDSTDTVTVLVDSTFIHLKVTGRDSICKGSCDTLMASGRDSTYFNWHPFTGGCTICDTIVVCPDTSTTYTGVAIDDIGCKDSVVFRVTVNPLPIIKVTPDPPILCKGRPLQLVATTTNTNNATTKFSWSPNLFISNDSVYNPIFDDTTNLQYKVTATSIYGCQDTLDIKMSVLDTNVNTIANDTNICIGGSADLWAVSHSLVSNLDVPTYTWTPAGSLNNSHIFDPVATPDTTTTYTVIIHENACFNDTEHVTVIVQPYPNLTITPGSETIVAGTPTQLWANVENTPVKYYAWSPANTLSCDSCLNPVAIPTVTTRYLVVVSSIWGCVVEDSVTLILTCDNSEVFVPNTFTPNGDGKNDRFFISAKGISLITLFQVYNRWGELVFEAHNILPNDQGAGWDGTYKGVVLEPDVFIWVAKAKCELGGVEYHYKGDVSIVK